MSNVQADWDNRHFIANIQYNIMKVVTFLNDFGQHTRTRSLTPPPLTAHSSLHSPPARLRAATARSSPLVLTHSHTLSTALANCPCPPPLSIVRQRHSRPSGPVE